MKTNFENMSEDEIRDWVLKTIDDTTELDPVKRAEIVNEVIDKLNDEVDPAIAEFIMQTRGKGCYDKHKEAMLGKVPDSVKQIADFIDYLGKRWSSFPDSIIDGLKRDGNVLTTRISKCPCDFVNASKGPISKTYCNCSAGFYHSIFEDFLGKPVKVDIVTSIVSGGDNCEIKITLPKETIKGYD